MMLFTIYACLIATILVITQETNAIYEYLHPFLPKFNYKDMKEDFTYIEYLETFHNNYFTRLIACPYCLGLVSAIVCGVLYSYIMIPPIYIGGLILYFIIKKLSN